MDFGKNMMTASALIAAAGFASVAQAQFLLNEILINPPGEEGLSGGQADDAFEFIEIAGVAGESLDGYAVAILASEADPGVDEIDEIFTFASGDVLVSRNSSTTGYFVLYNDSIAGDDTAFRNFVNDTNGTTFTLSGGKMRQSDGFAAFTDRDGTSRTTLNIVNDGSKTFLLLRKFDAAAWVHDAAAESGTGDTAEAGETVNTTYWTGVISVDLVDYQIVDEISYSDNSGAEYDRFDNEISDTPGYNPDAFVRLNYYTGENPQRGWVESFLDGATNNTNGAPNAAVGQLTRTSIADESWLRGDIDNVSGGNAGFEFLSGTPADWDAPSDYTSERIRNGYTDGIDLSADYAITPGFPNGTASSGGTNPFRPFLGQVTFQDGDVNFDGNVDCLDRALIEASSGVSLDERLDDGNTPIAQDGDYRWQGPELNALLAMDLDGDSDVDSTDLTNFDNLAAASSLNCVPCSMALSAPGDLNGDGNVDGADLLIIINNFQN